MDCADEIIEKIPTLTRLTVDVLSTAQAAVYRSMELKWYNNVLLYVYN